MKDQKPSLDVDFDLMYSDTDVQQLLMVGTARMTPFGRTACAGFSMTRAQIEKDPMKAIVAFAEALAAFYERNTSGVAVQAQDYKPEGADCALFPLEIAS